MGRLASILELVVRKEGEVGNKTGRLIGIGFLNGLSVS
jgi:hypothetical protein